MEAFPGPVRNDYNQGKTTNLYEYPSLLDTAELAYDLSSQSWSELGSTHDNIISNKNPFGIDKIDTLTDNILALLLIWVIAILCSNDDNNENPMTQPPLHNVNHDMIFMRGGGKDSVGRRFINGGRGGCHYGNRDGGRGRGADNGGDGREDDGGWCW